MKWAFDRFYGVKRIIFKSRDIILSTKVSVVKAMVFPVVMYRFESWTIKKTENLRTDAFELWCWRRLLSVPWTARRSNQSILKDICPGCSLEKLMLKLKLQYIGHLMQRADSLEKTLMLGKIEGRRRGNNRRWDGWMASLTHWTWVCVDSGSWWWIDGFPSGSPVPGILQARTLEWVAISSPMRESEVAQSCPTLCNPMYRSLPGSSVHGIFQARVLEWDASAFSVYPVQISTKLQAY